MVTGLVSHNLEHENQWTFRAQTFCQYTVGHHRKYQVKQDTLDTTPVQYSHLRQGLRQGFRTLFNMPPLTILKSVSALM